MSADRLIRFLKDREITLILADIGASGEPWEGFESLMPVSDVLRFDPDLRAIQSVSTHDGRRCVTINKAVVDDPRTSVDFFLTKSPFCSSTLAPDFERIRDYSYEDLFTVVGVSSLPAVTLEDAARLAGFPRIDWLKIDTQGTEFRILKSLPPALLNLLLVCDVEASLYAHYIGSDTLPEIHNLLRHEEFWVARMIPHWRTRGSRETQSQIEGIFSPGFKRRVLGHSSHQGPTTLEMTYARTTRGAARAGFDVNTRIRLFACHHALGAFEYCLEIANGLAQEKASADEGMQLAEIATDSIRNRTRKAILPYCLDALRLRADRLLRRFVR